MPDEANITPILDKPTVSRSWITIEYSPPKGISVRSAEVELVNGILQLTITTETETSEDYSVRDAIRALLGSWMIYRHYGEL